MGKNAVQVALCLDDSGSMERRINMCEKACLDLVDMLLDDSDHEIWISVTFIDKSAEPCQMSRNKEKIKKCIKRWEAQGRTPLDTGIETARTSYSTASENKVMAIFTDGIPDSVDRTVDQLKKNKQEDIRNFAISWGTDNYGMFNEEVTDYYARVDDGTAFLSEMRDKLVEFIQENYELTITQEVTPYNIEYGTDDDQQTYLNIANNFKDGFNWQNTKMFKMIDNYSGSDEDYEEAKKLSDATKFTITSNETYSITDIDTRIGSTEEKTNSKGVVRKRIHYKEKENNYTASLGLSERAPACLQLKEFASALKVTLANGQSLFYNTATYEETMNKTKSLTCFLDNELAQGAKVEIEYTVHIANKTGSIAFDELKFVDYLPENFVFDENTELLTEPDKKIEIIGM